MTDSNEQQATAAKTPKYDAYVVRKDKHDENVWVPVGAAWAHRKGQGLTVEIDLITHTLSLVLFPPKAKA